MYLNEATLLNNVRLRYNRDKIYVSNVPILEEMNLFRICKIENITLTYCITQYSTFRMHWFKAVLSMVDVVTVRIFLFW